MGTTPDRHQGESDEEGVVYENLAPGNDPTALGGQRFVNGEFRMKDQLGVFNPRDPSGSFTVATLDVTLPAKYDEISGTVTGLAGVPLHVLGFVLNEVATVQSGMRYLFLVTGLLADGFNWILKVMDDEYWPGPGPIVIKVHYGWSIL